jgi:class 3 adenylate cyclase
MNNAHGNKSIQVGTNDGQPVQQRLTFLITDVRGSTPLWERRPAAMHRATLAHDRILRAAIEARGGRAFKVVGDSVFAAFEQPCGAIEAALAAMRALRVHDARRAEGEIALAERVRFGIHHGHAYAYGADYLGLDVCVAKRIAEVGHGGQLLLTDAATHALEGRLPAGCELSQVGRYRMKGVARPITIRQAQTEDLPHVWRPPVARAARGQGWRKLVRWMAALFL